MSNIPQMNGMQQVIVATPTQDQINSAAAVKMQFNVGPDNIIASPAITTVISAANALAGNDIIRLSKFKKQRLACQGLVEIDQTWTTQPTFQLVTQVVGATGQTVHGYQYVAPAARPSITIAETDDGIVYTSLGTFTETTGTKDGYEPYTMFGYDNNASSSSANDGLVGPQYTALGADELQQLQVINDNPGLTGGAPMTEQNYLSFPGDPVVTSATAQYYLDKIDAMRIAANASALVYSDIVNAGIDPNNVWTGLYASKPAKLTNYKAGIVAATSTITRAALEQIVFTANH